MSIDLEALSKLARILFIPFFAVAGAIDGWMPDLVTDIPDEYKAFALAARIIIRGLLFIFMHLLITPFIFRYAAYGGDLEREALPLPVLIGLLCLTSGLYGLGTSLFPGIDLPKSPLNIFWHLGFFTYGLFLLI